MRMADKRPARRWKGLQTKRATRSKITNWFGNGSRYGIGVIFGDISGGLVSRDFDDLVAYETWAANHPDAAATLPTVETCRGHHVYFRAGADAVNEVRSMLGKLGGRGAIKFADGELRCGVGCYSVLPPSQHPSGHIYRWVVPLPNGALPEIDLLASGFVPEAILATERDGENRAIVRSSADTTNTSLSHVFSNPQCSSDFSVPLCLTEPNGDLERQIEQAIRDSLPTGPGRRNDQVFVLARALKAIPATADAPPMSLRPIVEKWHRLALPLIGTKPFEETLIDFLHAWPRVKYPKGSEPIATHFAAAQKAETPVEAMQFEQPALRLLVALCRQLQGVSGEQPFFLSCRTAGNLLGVRHSQANRWLFLLSRVDLLKEVTKGTRATGRASRYRYLGKL